MALFPWPAMMALGAQPWRVRLWKGHIFFWGHGYGLILYIQSKYPYFYICFVQRRKYDIDNHRDIYIYRDIDLECKSGGIDTNWCNWKSSECKTKGLLQNQGPSIWMIIQAGKQLVALIRHLCHLEAERCPSWGTNHGYHLHPWDDPPSISCEVRSWGPKGPTTPNPKPLKK